MVYISLFLFTFIICICIDSYNNLYMIKIGNYDCKWVPKILLLISIFPLVFIGTFRAINIGTDNTLYSLWFQNMAKITNIIDGINYGTTDIGYNLLSFFVSRFSSSYTVMCFATSIITISVLFISLYFIREEISISFSTLIFMLMFFCNLLNLVRQGIALSLSFTAIIFLSRDKMKLYFIFLVLAVLFHNTAICLLIMYPIYQFISIGNAKLKFLIIFIMSYSAIILMGRIVSTLVSVGILRSRYLNYLPYMSGFPFSFRQTVFYLPLVIFSIFNIKNIESSKQGKLYFSMAILGFVFSQLEDLFGPLSRVGLYFSYSYLLLIPMIFRKEKRISNKLVYAGLILIYLLVFWIYFTVMNGYGFSRPVYPYEFV